MPQKNTTCKRGRNIIWERGGLVADRLVQGKKTQTKGFQWKKLKLKEGTTKTVSNTIKRGVGGRGATIVPWKEAEITKENPRLASGLSTGNRRACVSTKGMNDQRVENWGRKGGIKVGEKALEEKGNLRFFRLGD